MPDVSRIPDWQKGGRASASGFNALKQSVAAIQRSLMAAGLMDSTGMALRKPVAGGARQYMAIITGSSLQSGHVARWNYTATKAWINSSGEPEAIPSESSFTCINLHEFAHPADGSYAWGNTIANDNATLTPLPVGGGESDGSHTNDITVTITERRKPDGTLLRTFEAQGSIYVDCNS